MSASDLTRASRQFNGGNQHAAKASYREAMIEKLKADNARRVPCATCGIKVLPENMAHHLYIHDLCAGVD